MSKQTRAEWWFLMSYATLEELQNLFDNCHHYAYCIHDKDTDEDGEPKVPHKHILVKFETKKSLDQIKTLINSSQNTFGECQRKVGNNWVSLNKTACFRYLLHLDDSDKYQYEVECRITDDNSFWERYKDYQQPFTTTCDDTFYEDLLRPYASKWEFIDTMSRKYGRDFIKNSKTYEAFRQEALMMELERDDIIYTTKIPKDFDKIYHLIEDMELTYEEVERVLQAEYNERVRFGYLYNERRLKLEKGIPENKY